MQGSTTGRLFRALGDETRRDILTMLKGGPLTSGEIAARFDSSWPTISRHLGVLRDAGLVRAARRGQEISYELNTSVFQDLAQYMLDWIKPQRAPRSSRARARHQEA